MAATADPLALYNAKRDFAKTAEPRGKVPRSKGNRFIVQKHDATRLHLDLRLEMDGHSAVVRGANAYPGSAGPEISKQFREFRAAVERLIGRSIRF